MRDSLQSISEQDEDSQYIAQLVLSPDRELFLNLQPYHEQNTEEIQPPHTSFLDLEKTQLEETGEELDELRPIHELDELKHMTPKRSPAPDPAGDEDGNGLTLSITANMDALR